MPAGRNRRVAGLNVANEAVSCVTYASEPDASRWTRNVPCSQLTTEKSPRFVGSRNSTTSSPVRNRGTPETRDVMSPMLPPKRRTAIRSGASPLHVSSTSNELSVQISPASLTTALPLHRACTITGATRAIFASDIRSIVVAPAAAAKIDIIIASFAAARIDRRRACFSITSPPRTLLPRRGRCSMC
jgi:hypothetical protein